MLACESIVKLTFVYCGTFKLYIVSSVHSLYSIVISQQFRRLFADSSAHQHKLKKKLKAFP